jgi:hypothetical protein
MRRMLLLMAVAATMLALTAGPALAARDKTGDLPPFKDQPPGNAQEAHATLSHTPNLTEQNGKNFIGQDASNSNKGIGGNPGSAAEPTTFNGEPAFNGPVTSTIGTLPGTVFDPNTTKPNVISAFQEFKRCSLLGPASCPTSA